MSKFNRYQAECVIPWVNDVLLLLTIALQSAQQLKDKVSSTLISGHVSKLGREQIKKIEIATLLSWDQGNSAEKRTGKWKKRTERWRES